MSTAATAIGSSQIATAAFGGALSGVISSGNLRGALQGALSAGLFYGAGSVADAYKVGVIGHGVLHAAAGCLSSVAAGSDCGSGALSGGFSDLTGDLVTTKKSFLAAIGHGILGGIASRLGGGSFGDGFQNGAYGSLFNDVMHSKSDKWLENNGRPLNETETDRYRDFFSADVLAGARIIDGKVPWWLAPNFNGITLHNDIYFRPNVYDPNSAYGVELLGHELVHVEQYSKGMTVPGYIWASRGGYRSNPYEVEAYSRGAKIRSAFCAKSRPFNGC